MFLQIVNGNDIRRDCEGSFRAMVRDTRECVRPQPSCRWSTVRLCSVWRPKFDRSVTGTSQEFLVLSPAHALDQILMSRSMPYLIPAGQIPDLDNSITASTGKSLQRIRILRKGVHSIDMTLPKLRNERRCKHPL